MAGYNRSVFHDAADRFANGYSKEMFEQRDATPLYSYGTGLQSLAYGLRDALEGMAADIAALKAQQQTALLNTRQTPESRLGPNVSNMIKK